MKLNSEDNELIQNEKKIEELAIKLDNLDRETAALFEELGISPQEISEFIESRDNFSDQEWELIQNQKTIAEKNLQVDLTSLKDPRKTKKAYKSLNIQPNWIPVR
jgi:hypothetical protein